MKTVNLSMAVFVAICLNASLYAAKDQKMMLKADRTLVFDKIPPKVDNFEEILAKGMFYGRLRINTFRYDWKKEYPGSTKDNWSMGVGGSVLYRSAEYKGLSGMAGIYTSQNPWHMDNSDVGYLKAGKGVTDRDGVKKDGDWGMTTLAQSYLQYSFSKTKIRAGRQIFESFLTKSNDTKMIPNTFEGFSVVSKDLNKTVLKAACLMKQKLRDHDSFHDVLTYKDATGDTWGNNDDTVANHMLNYQNFINAGEDPNHDLIVLEVTNRSIKNATLKANYTAVPNVVSSAAIEAHYAVLIENFKIIPGIRYMKQFDALDGKIANVANLKGKATGYANPNSLDSWLVAGKIDIKSDESWKFRIGYSKIADDADIIAPWRGFPTGGFTRAMAQYNWYANTKTYMARFDYDFGKAGFVPGLSGMLRYAIQDFDDTKPGVQADSNVVNIDAIEKFKSYPGLQARVRIAIASGDAQSGSVAKRDPSYREYRFELNYLF